MIPITLISGFLGSGKTTFLSHLIKTRDCNAGKLAVVVNEFAELGLDGVKLPDGDYEKWELNKGSIFCICMRTDFISLLEKIADQIHPEELWIEATGIADVSEVFKMISVPSLRDKVFLKTHVCIVDPNSIIKILSTLRAAKSQVKLADAIILNKIDTANEQKLLDIEKIIREINSNAPIFRAVQAEIDPSEIPSFNTPRQDTKTGNGHMPQPVTSISVTENWIIPPDAFVNWCAKYGDKIWRVKGKLATPNGFRWVEKTINSIVFSDCNDDILLPSPTSIAIVGKGINKENILKELKNIAVNV